MNFVKIATLAMLVISTLTGTAVAEVYPSRPVKIIVPFPPGGASDVLARLIGDKLSQSLKVPFIVDNRAGGGTIIGTTAAAQAAPDGYTILLTNNSLAVNASLRKQLAYDTRSAFVSVAYLGSQSNVMMVNSSFPAKTVQEFIALARAKPGTLAVASGGVGGSSHLALELFKILTGVEVIHVPFQGGAPAVTGLLGNFVQAYFDTVSSAAPYAQSGDLRALAVTTKERSPILKDVPTMIESGVEGFDAGNWNGVFAPAGTPVAVVMRLNQEITKILQMPDVSEKFVSFGIEPKPSPPEFLASHLESEISRWAEVIRKGNIQPE